MHGHVHRWISCQADALVDTHRHAFSRAKQARPENAERNIEPQHIHTSVCKPGWRNMHGETPFDSGLREDVYGNAAASVLSSGRIPAAIGAWVGAAHACTP